MDNETLKLIEDCRDLMVDINSNLSRMDSSKKIVEDQVQKLNDILNKKINHMFI
jgi:hypothetical protein